MADRRPLRGVFEVWSGDTKLGTVAANPEKGRNQTLLLQTVKDITIRPVMEQMPEGYLIQDAPIAGVRSLAGQAQ